ncbi:aldehyde dehydrogenase [Priestia aryabhattai]|uniref:aldehyde dehydrogenase family protein n=1 Tax=Priestia flexa TaxID=86664 RepID=UPI000BA06B4E|nr:aldehyde dehydrogenase family protein [Priestia flexa]MDT2046797.1 aldehyde dehydrogenase family protein [Priestia flexa]OZT14581.1 aldehyde dehydrogenase [Priestia aryabhattai]USY53211.1 aldehyde dehydrogenase family protein [Bacillus sp. 1780r2a1]
MLKHEVAQQLFINGKWKAGSDFYDLTSPYSKKMIASVPLANETDVEAAIKSAHKGAEQMRQLTSLERSEILEKVSTIFKEKAEQAAEILALECAKPIKDARAEISRTIETYKFASEEAKRIHGEIIPMDAAKNGKGRLAFTVREPLGTIAAITPFNFPFNLVAHKLGPAFAAGNSVILKPATQTPLSALFTARAFEEAGLPAGALNVVTGKGSVIGNQLVKDSRIKMITFTGSLEVGLDIKRQSGLKKVTLELGSNSAVIVDSVEHLGDVVERCIQGAFSYAGQVCISVQRIYVQKELYHLFLEKFIEKAKRLIIADPLLESTDLSSMINISEAERVEKWIHEAVEAGAKVVCGGQREGAILQPTVITEAKQTLPLNCKEAFAPIVTITPYEQLEEAITLVNNSEYGLQAGVYTTSIRKAFYATENLQVGGVMINDIPTYRVDQMPYGGVKNSGTGREGIKYSIDEMTELKLVNFKL